MWEHSVKKFEVGVGTMDTVCDPGQGIKSGTVGVGVQGMCEDTDMYGNCGSQTTYSYLN